MFKVRVQNFQSIADAAIEVGGFTVITGPNNSGKSALMRALRGAFQNTKGSGFVRHKKSKATVTVKFSDGKMLEWSKGTAKKDKPTYTINGGSPIHPGQQVPDEVRELGVIPIQAGGRDIWPQFAPQFTGQIFLLDQPGSVLAEAVADVERVSQLNGALKMSEKDRRSAGSTLKVRMSDRETYKGELKRFEGLDDLDTEVQGIEQGLQKAAVVEKAVLGLSDLRDRLAEATEGVNALQGIEDVEVPDDEGFDSLAAFLDEADELQDLKFRHEGADQRVKSLAGVEGIEIDIDIKPATRFLDALGVLQDLKTRHGAAIKKVADLEAGVAREEVSLESAEKAVTVLLGDMGECPICGSMLGECNDT